MEELWRRVSEKKYQILVEGEWQSLDVPYGKVEMIMAEFNKGLLDHGINGIAESDIEAGLALGSFGAIGDIVLAKFDDKGKLVEEGNAAALGMSETVALFEIALDIIKNFTKVIGAMKARNAAPAVDAQVTETETKD